MKVNSAALSQERSNDQAKNCVINGGIQPPTRMSITIRYSKGGLIYLQIA